VGRPKQIKLVGVPTKFQCKGKTETNREPVDDRQVKFHEVDSFLLSLATHGTAGFVLIDFASINAAFAFE